MNEHSNHAHGAPKTISQTLALAIGSVGVVYGDIGTSPLYAFREALRPLTAHGVQRADVIGLISLFIWALTIIVTLKYVIILLRADNDGEGGTLSLLSLTMRTVGPKTVKILFFVGIVGGSLFLGDSMITPALSVMSAVEGIKLVTPALDEFVVPISVIILVLLFTVQSNGTGRVSAFFGPITMVWFLVMAIGGISHIADDYTILEAFNPLFGLKFIASSGFVGFIVLGAVFLAVTGAEALYADLGHFGRTPIRLAWFGLIFPSLTLNYLGQGAMVLHHPEALEDPFFLMFPEWALLPVVLLATVATIIASQAVITGAFSLTRQAISLGYLPRMDVFHTSESNTGQIYLPAVNSILLFGVMVLVLMFRSSQSLAVAYGIAVTGDMVVSSVLLYFFFRSTRGWKPINAMLAISPFLAIELVFLSANITKIHHGGYVPVLIAAGFIVVMWTWRRGSTILSEKTRRTDIPLDVFLRSVEKKSEHGPVSVPGTAIFLTSDPEFAPAALLHNLKHNHVLHEQNFTLTVRTANQPKVEPAQRCTVNRVSDRFCKLEVRFGYLETPNVSQALAQLKKSGLKFDIMTTSFYLGRRKLVPDPKSGMPAWQDRLFITLANAAADPSDYFRLPTNRVVELGSHVVI